MRTEMKNPSYAELTAAKNLLELQDRATRKEIRTAYTRLLKRWHPDTHPEDSEACTEMTARIVAAYRLISCYCDAYQYSFSEEELRRHLSDEEWWADRFGQDPLWGSGRT
ncbi:J domain-containing protein [Desulfomicrobium salsuginis]